MAEYNISNATTTDLKNQVPDFIMDSKKLDSENDSGETYTYFPEVSEYLGYYCNDPIVFSAANNLATWAFGRGWVAEDAETNEEFEHVTGRGNDTYSSLMWNHEIIKLIVGDAFMEIIWQDDDHTKAILNLVPISPERVKIVSKNGRIRRYEIWNGGKWVKKKPSHIYHTSNKRIADQVHGTSQIPAIKKYLDMRNEATDDERTIKHRDKALGVVYYKTNNTGKISYANSQIEKAVKNGDMVGLPEDTAKIEPYPSKSSEDRTAWISYLENFTYQTFGVPRSIATSDGTSEVGGINGHLIFEPIYGKEQHDEEEATWQQMFRKIKWNRPPSLAPKTQENAEKNTGQTAIQPAEVTPQENR